jgi:hypothetical protein
LPNAFHSRFGPVLGLGPMSSHLAAGDGRASSAELRHLAGKPERGRVLQFGVATCVTARDRSPFEAFCSGLPTGVLGRKRRATGQVTVRRGDPMVASRGVPTYVGPVA